MLSDPTTGELAIDDWHKLVISELVKYIQIILHFLYTHTHSKIISHIVLQCIKFQITLEFRRWNEGTTRNRIFPRKIQSWKSCNNNFKTSFHPNRHKILAME